MKELVNLLQKCGFVYQGSQIYGGLANTWDFGPLGTKLINNIKNEWRKHFTNDFNIFEIDSSILLNPLVWKTSGHIDNFTDPLIDCKECKKRFRIDTLINEQSSSKYESLKKEEIINEIKKLKCPECKKSNFTDIRDFDLLFKTEQGIVKDSKNSLYLRPEIAQGIFINFLNVQRSTRAKLPFGIGQIGKSFRNEITPGNFIFRTREFEQMELEFFVKKNDASKYYEIYKEKTMNYFLNIGIDKSKLHFRDHEKNELAHYSSETSDIEFDYSFGKSELAGISNRGDFDLKSHSEKSNEVLEYLDDLSEKNEKFIPYVIEPSIGVGRTFLALLESAFTIEKLEDGNERNVLKLLPKIAPIKIAVLSLTNKFKEESINFYNELKKEIQDIQIDFSGSIGKRYRRQDEIGTPFCITVDHETLENKTVTLRYRDSMKQHNERLSLKKVIDLVKINI